MLLAGVGGCVSPDGQGKTAAKAKPFGAVSKGMAVPGVVTPDGAPVMATAAAKPAAGKATAKKTGDVVQASATADDPGVQQAAGFSRIRGSECADGSCGAHTPGLMSRIGHHDGIGHGHGGGYDPYAMGPMGSGLGTALGLNGIMPVPQMGPPGAVAAVGAIGPGGALGPVATGMRTSVRFVSPQGMKVTWLGPNGYIEPGLVAPAPYNFAQGNAYRLKVSGVPRQPGRVYYPTLEVYPATLKTLTFLSHNTVPLAVTDEDFERVNAGSMVVKVIYLPDPAFQDAAAIAGAEELVSTNLAPGVDPIVEATSRGTILAVLRMGNIDLENPFSPAMDAPGAGGPPPGMAAPGMMGAPGMLPPGAPGMMPGPGMMAPPAMPAPPAGVPVKPVPNAGPIAPGGMPKAPAVLPPVGTPASLSK
jgi:hypothetical protein